jgi:hypothetical protein
MGDIGLGVFPRYVRDGGRHPMRGEEVSELPDPVGVAPDRLAPEVAGIEMTFPGTDLGFEGIIHGAPDLAQGDAERALCYFFGAGKEEEKASLAGKT